MIDDPLTVNIQDFRGFWRFDGIIGLEVIIRRRAFWLNS